MAIRIDPRRLTLLKEIAAAQGLRPGQLVQRWVEERLDAERQGRTIAEPENVARLAALEASVASLAARVEAVAQAAAQPRAPVPAQAEPDATTEPAPVAADTAPRRRGRPPKGGAGRPAKRAAASATGAASAGRVPLHEEIIAVISERGPSTAAEIADAIRDRGRYHAPRSSRPLDAATVNGRVSNPVYRSRFARSGRRIGLAE